MYNLKLASTSLIVKKEVLNPGMAISRVLQEVAVYCNSLTATIKMKRFIVVDITIIN
jgi:hypothetical protein